MNTRMKGAFTIEAAVVVPLVMMLFLAVLYLTFLLHDKAGVKAIAAYALWEYAADPDAGTDPGISGMLKKGLIMESAVSASIKGNRRSAQAAAQASWAVLPAMVRLFMGISQPLVRTEVQISHLNGRDFLLPYKAAADGADRIVDGSRE